MSNSTEFWQLKKSAISLQKNFLGFSCGNRQNPATTTNVVDRTREFRKECKLQRGRQLNAPIAILVDDLSGELLQDGFGYQKEQSLTQL